MAGFSSRSFAVTAFAVTAFAFFVDSPPIEPVNSAGSWTRADPDDFYLSAKRRRLEEESVMLAVIGFVLDKA